MVWWIVYYALATNPCFLSPFHTLARFSLATPASSSFLVAQSGEKGLWLLEPVRP
jgi:hypothetical protein